MYGTPNTKYKFGGTLLSRNLKTLKKRQNFLILHKNNIKSKDKKKSAAHLEGTDGTKVCRCTLIGKCYFVIFFRRFCQTILTQYFRYIWNIPWWFKFRENTKVGIFCLLQGLSSMLFVVLYIEDLLQILRQMSHWWRLARDFSISKYYC